MSLFEKTISIISPPSCVECGAEGAIVCVRCLQENLLDYGQRCGGCGVLSPNSKTCANCRRLGLPGYIWICTNYKGFASKLVYKYKFDHQRYISELMARLMAESFGGQQEYTVVGVPTATKRVRERSFDHSLLLTKNISRHLGYPKAKVLSRIGQNAQVGAGRSARFNQAAHQYYVSSPRAVTGKTVLLVDDVITTGASLAAANTILRRAGAVRVDALVFTKKM